jgi:hypothetical protein
MTMIVTTRDTLAFKDHVSTTYSLVHYKSRISFFATRAFVPTTIRIKSLYRFNVLFILIISKHYHARQQRSKFARARAHNTHTHTTVSRARGRSNCIGKDELLLTLGFIMFIMFITCLSKILQLDCNKENINDGVTAEC